MSLSTGATEYDLAVVGTNIGLPGIAINGLKFEVGEGDMQGAPANIHSAFGRKHGMRRPPHLRGGVRVT